MSGPYSGYHDCPCPDCFEIAIGVREVGKEVEPAFCSACEEAGCDGISTCEAWEPEEEAE